MYVIPEAFFPSTITTFQKDTLQQLVKILGAVQEKAIILSLMRNAEDRSRELEATPVWLSFQPHYSNQLNHATLSTEQEDIRQNY